MARICTDINQKDEMLFWLKELTHLSSQQAEAMLSKMHSEQSPETADAFRRGLLAQQ